MKRCLYRCAFGHGHTVFAAKPPVEMYQRHGRREGHPPHCNALLKLVKTEPL